MFQYGHIQYSISLTLCYITISASCFILHTSQNRMYCGVSLSNTDILLQLFHILRMYKIIEQEDNIKISECVKMFYNLHQNGWYLLLVVSTEILYWSVVMCAIWNTSNITYWHYCTPIYHDMIIIMICNSSPVSVIVKTQIIVKLVEILKEHVEGKEIIGWHTNDVDMNSSTNILY